MTTAPEEDERTTTQTTTVSAEKVLDRLTRVEHGKLTGALLDDDTGELVVEVEVPVGECPACGFDSRGTTAWNGAHDREFCCTNPECGVERFKDPNATEVDES